MTPLQARTLSRATIDCAATRRGSSCSSTTSFTTKIVAGCAQASLEWLARYAGVKRSVCLAVDSEGGVLVGHRRLRRAQRRRRSLHLAAHRYARSARRRARPRRARSSSAPARVNGHVGRVTPRRRSAPGRSPPFRCAARQDDGEALGLLLLRPWTGSTADISWLATVLGQKIEQIRGRGSLARKSGSCAASARCSSPSSTPSPTRFC